MYTLGKFKATDVFTMATMLSKIGLGKVADGFGKENIMNLLSEYKGKKKEDASTLIGMQVMIQAAEIILGNLDKCEEEVFKLLASITGAPVDELKNLDMVEFAELVVSVVKHPQFKDFIKVASKLLNTEN